MRYLILILILSSLNSFSQDTITIKKVYNYCLEVDIKHPDIVTAQSILETGWYKCKYCCLTSNNIFGFYYQGNYIEFNSWKQSIDYYKIWQDKYYVTDNSYYEFLSCTRKNNRGECLSYSANPENYNTKLIWIVNKIKEDLD